MNQKKARTIRKIVYANVAPTKTYTRTSTGQIINVGDMEEVDNGTGRLVKVPRRRLYQHLKSVTRGIRRTVLKRVFGDATTKVN